MFSLPLNVQSPTAYIVANAPQHLRNRLPLLSPVFTEITETSLKVLKDPSMANLWANPALILKDDCGHSLAFQLQGFDELEDTRMSLTNQ